MDDPAGTDLRLHTFGGRPPPPPVADGWTRLLELPPAARDALWDLLAPALLEPSHPGMKERLAAFCGEHGIEEDRAVAAVHACEVVLGRASAIDLDRGRLGEDLAALSGDGPEVPEMILSRYDGVKGELRRRILRRSLADHGKVLHGVDWRVDRVLRSSHGENLDASVPVLTLRCREGSRSERITLYLTPAALRDLERFIASFRR